MLLAPKLKPCVQLDNDPAHKKILLQEFKDDSTRKEVNDWIREQGLEQGIVDDEIEFTYENYTMHDALQMLLPKNIREQDRPSGFEVIGDIAHMNLHESLLDYRFQIGQVVLDKNKNLRTVVRKVGQIESEFRFYDLECIAGEKDNYETIQVEDKVRFKVDISKVYWCSKLATERTRMINTFLKDGEVLCDMFCGIGPLAVKSAVMRKGLRVVCNDLNPEGIKYCKENVKLNKVDKRVLPYNMDAREFVRFVVA